MAASGKADGALMTISEVSDQFGIPQHILRYWETRFPELRPLTRAGKRRYYRPADVALVARIDGLLNREGYTIKGVLKLIADKGVAGLEAGAAMSAAVAHEPLAAAALAAAPYSEAPELPLPTAAPAPALDVSTLYAIRDRLAGALAEARAA